MRTIVPVAVICCVLTLIPGLYGEDAWLPISRLEVANRTGNIDYVLLHWGLTNGPTKDVVYTVQVFDEGGKKRWEDVTGLVKTEKLASVYVGEPGCAYRFRSLARLKNGATEQKKEDKFDARVTPGSAHKETGFTVNPYPLCPGNSGGDFKAYETFSLVRGEYMQMAYGYGYTGEGNMHGKRGDVVVEVPQGVNIKGATYMHHFNRERGPIPIYNCGQVKRDGKTYSVYFAPNKRIDSVETPYYGYRHLLRVYFEPAPDYEGGDTLYWYTIKDGIAAPRESAGLEVLPELEITGVPKNFKNLVRMQPELYPTEDPHMTAGSDPPFILKRYELIRKMGIPIVANAYAIANRRTYWLVENGFEVLARGAIGHGWMMPSYYHAPKREYLEIRYGKDDRMFWVDAKGRDPFKACEERGRPPRWCYYCPDFMARRDTTFYKKWTETGEIWWRYNRSACRDLGIKPVDFIDFEISMGSAIFDYCFCPRCLDRFAEEAELSREGLTTEKILADHAEQWRDFRVRQNGKIVRTWHEANKRLTHRLMETIAMVNVQPNPPVGTDNLDVRQIDRFIDGYKDELTFVGRDLFDHIHEFCSYIRKPCTIYPNPCSQLRVVSPTDARMAMLATAAAGGTGFMTDQWFRTHRPSLSCHDKGKERNRSPGNSLPARATN